MPAVGARIMPLATFRAISQKTKSVESITQGSVFTNGAADGGVALSQRKTHLRKEELILANRQQLSEMQKDCDLKSMVRARTETVGVCGDAAFATLLAR